MEPLFEFELVDELVFGFLRGIEDGVMFIEVSVEVFGVGLLSVPLGRLVGVRLCLPDCVVFEG